VGNFFTSSVSENRLKRRIRRSLPALATEYNRNDVDELVRRELQKRVGPISGLVVGAGERPAEIESRFPDVSWLTTDVDMAYRPLLIADTLKLPIADASQDLVVAEMVIEHVMDISQAARELERVCKPGGLVLVKAPFCFPWHGVPTDFFRCTPSGIRALFRSMETIHLGRCMGPWGALAYQLDTLVVNLTSVRYVRLGSAFASRFMFGWLKWLDWLSPSRKRDLITSSGVTFVGRKMQRSFTAREILEELQQLYGSGKV
jgi:SAM-dependent methyltransferase